MPIVDAVLEEFERTYHLLLHCFPDVRSLVEPVARDRYRESSLYCSNERSHVHSNIESATSLIVQSILSSVI